MQWLNHCVLWQIFLVVVFVWAPAPFVCLVCCFSWRNASLAGGFAGRLAGLCVVVVVVICLHFQTVLSLYKVTFYRLCSCKDRATVRHRPHSRKKKTTLAATTLAKRQGCPAGRKYSPTVETHASLFPTCRRHQRSHFQLGHLAHLASEDTKPLPPQFQHLSQRPWCLVLHPMKDLRLCLRLLQDLWGYLHEDAVGAPEPAAGELVVDEHRKSGCPVSQRAFCPAGLGGRIPWCLVVYVLRLGSHYGKHTTRGASGIHPQHNHTGIPDQWSKGKSR